MRGSLSGLALAGGASALSDQYVLMHARRRPAASSMIGSVVEDVERVVGASSSAALALEVMTARWP